jgi:hypothetical protein
MRAAWAIYKRELIANLLLAPRLRGDGVVPRLQRGGVLVLHVDDRGNPALVGSRGAAPDVLRQHHPLGAHAADLLPRDHHAHLRRRATLPHLRDPLHRARHRRGRGPGKFFGAITFYAPSGLPTLLYALVVRRYGPVDWGALAAAYAGVLLIGSALRRPRRAHVGPRALAGHGLRADLRGHRRGDVRPGPRAYIFKKSPAGSSSPT